MKKCNKCSIEKPFTDYGLDKRNKDGRQGICEGCRKIAKQMGRSERMAGINITPIHQKVCNKCGTEKSAESFFKDSGISDGRATICKECKLSSTMEWRSKNRERYNATMRAYHKKHYTKFRLLRYNLSEKDYLNLLEEQKHVCAICENPPSKTRPLVVDHCHETGRIRGLLCYGCNRALHTIDNKDLFVKAMNYINK